MNAALEALVTMAACIGLMALTLGGAHIILLVINKLKP